MKKIVGILLALTLLAGLYVAPASAATNLIEDADFSLSTASGLSEAWGRFKSGSATALVPSKFIATLSDSHGQCLSVPYGGWAAYQWIDGVEGGKTYTFSTQYNAANDGRGFLGMSYYQEQSTYVSEETIRLPKTNGWQRITFNISVPVGANTIQLQFRANANIGAKLEEERLYFDSMSLYEAEDPGNILNASIESVSGASPTIYPAGWAINEGATADTVPFDGNYSLSVTDTGTASTIIYLPENTNELSGYVKTTGGATAQLTLTELWTYNAPVHETVQVTSETWEKTSFETFSATAGSWGMLSLSVTGDGTAYFDNFSLESYTNLVPNHSFESGKPTDADYVWEKNGGKEAFKDMIETVSDAPDGAKALVLDGSIENSSTNNMPSITLTAANLIPVEAGNLYEISYWAKGTSDYAATMVHLYEGSNTAATEAISPKVVSVKNSGTWKKSNLVVYIPKAGTYGSNTISADVTKIDIELRTATKLKTTCKLYFDMVCVRKIDGYAGFYDSTPMNWMDGSNKPAAFLGEKVEPTLSAGSYTFRFDDIAYYNASTGSTALAVAALYAKKEGEAKKLTKIVALENIENSPYIWGTDVTTYTSANGKYFDAGFRLPITITADMLTEDAEYSLEILALDSAGGLKPIISKTVVR